jgi:hypothetical protein
MHDVLLEKFARKPDLGPSLAQSGSEQHEFGLGQSLHIIESVIRP